MQKLTKKTVLKWLTLAQSKCGKRPQLECLYYNKEADELVATDGHRLHMLKNASGFIGKDFKTGSYVVVGEDLFPKKDAENFPPYRKVIPEKMKPLLTLSGQGTLKTKNGSHYSMAMASLANTSICLNIHYLADALFDGADFDIQQKECGAPVRLEGDFGLLAVIMPLRP